MIEYFCYTEFGEITKVGSCQEEVLDLHKGPTEFIGRGKANQVTQYIDVSTGSVVDKPTAPNSYSRFNYLTKEWEYDATLASIESSAVRKQAIEASIASGYTYESNVFQIDKASRDSITAKVMYLQLSADTEVKWVAADNTIVTMTRDSFLEFALEVTSYYESLLLDQHA